jgi:hypothetical protein
MTFWVGLQQVVSPNMFNMQLWETSGHAQNYKENMFTFEVCDSYKVTHSFLSYSLVLECCILSSCSLMMVLGCLLIRWRNKSSD